MDILDFMDLGIKVEIKISALYELAARKAAILNPEFATQLKLVSQEEIGHANVLRMGRNYAVEMPDLFSRKNINISEVQKGFEEGELAMDKLSTEEDLKTLLINLLDLEKLFERHHLMASVEIRDDSLKSLFVSLSKGDNSHISIVRGILAKL